MFEIREYIDDRDRVTNREVVNILEEVGDLERTVVNAEGGGEGDLDEDEKEQKLKSALGDIKAKVEHKNYAGNNDEELEFVRELERIERRRKKNNNREVLGGSSGGSSAAKSESLLERELDADEGVLDTSSGGDVNSSSVAFDDGLDPKYFDDLAAEEIASMNRIREQDRQMLLKQQEKAAKVGGGKSSGGWSSGFLSKPSSAPKTAAISSKRIVSFAEPSSLPAPQPTKPESSSTVPTPPTARSVKERPFGDAVKERPFAKRN